MTPLAGGTTVLLVGAMLIRLTVSDAYQRYVRAGMGPWLLLAGALLVLLGGVTVVTALRRPPSGPGAADPAQHAGHGDLAGRFSGPGHTSRADADDAHDDHGHHTGVGWLLLVPVLALLLVAPPALGSFGVERSRVTTAASGTDVFAPLPPGAPPRTMTMLEFDQRAFDRGGSSLRGAKVRLTGFVAQPADGAGFRLARYQIACCAADAVAAVARISGSSGAAPARDAWFTVTGAFHGLGPDGVPDFVASAVQQIPPHWTPTNERERSARHR